MSYSETDHLKDKNSDVVKTYYRLVEKLRNFGPVKIEPKKTSIHLVSRFAFASVYTRKEYIRLEFQLYYKLDKERILKVEQLSPNRFHHSIRLDSASDIDPELVAWLKEAYILKA